MILALAFVLFELADLTTALLMPAGSERNPAAMALVASPVQAVVTKVILLVVVFYLLLGNRYRNRVLAFGAVAGAVGTLSNLLVLA